MHEDYGVVVSAAEAHGSMINASDFEAPLREALPPAIATAGVVSVWAARHLAKHESLQISVALSWGWLPFLLAGAVVVWLSQRGLK